MGALASLAPAARVGLPERSQRDGRGSNGNHRVVTLTDSVTRRKPMLRTNSARVPTNATPPSTFARKKPNDPPSHRLSRSLRTNPIAVLSGFAQPGSPGCSSFPSGGAFTRRKPTLQSPDPRTEKTNPVPSWAGLAKQTQRAVERNHRHVGRPRHHGFERRVPGASNPVARRGVEETSLAEAFESQGFGRSHSWLREVSSLIP